MRRFHLTPMLLCLFGAACSGKTAAPVGPSAQQACADFAQTRCNKRVSCSNAIDPTGINLKRNYTDIAECQAREALGCVNALAAPDTGNDVDAVAKCVAAYANYSCADFLDNDPPIDCMPSGSRATGQPCTFNAQCVSAYCSGNKIAACGTCAAPPAAGNSCAASNCAHAEQCVASTTLCQVRAEAGAACDADHPCASGLSCTGSTKTMMGACQTAASVEGTACGATMPGCAGNQGLACTGATGAKTCTKMTFAADGMPCGLLSDGSRVDCAAGDCYTMTGLASGSDLGTCRANAADGSACDSVLGPPCIAPARCIPAGAGSAGMCTVPTSSGCN